MKENTHPKYFQTTARCACGATYKIGSTKENIRIDICSKCHPLFTGTEKMLDTAGRVEKFRKKYELAAEREKVKKETAADKKTEKEKAEKKQEEEAISLMGKLDEMRKGKEEKTPSKEAKASHKPAAHKPAAKKAAAKKKSK